MSGLREENNWVDLMIDGFEASSHNVMELGEGSVCGMELAGRNDDGDLRETWPGPCFPISPKRTVERGSVCCAYPTKGLPH